MTEKKETKKKVVKKKAVKKKTAKKEVKASDNPNITRTFVNGEMVVEFKNGRTREITIAQLELRKGRIADNIAKRGPQIQNQIDKLTERIGKEEDGTKKARLQTFLDNITERQANLPTQEELETKIQGWIDAAKASI